MRKELVNLNYFKIFHRIFLRMVGNHIWIHFTIYFFWESNYFPRRRKKTNVYEMFYELFFFFVCLFKFLPSN